jgi:peptide/nickel transport system substrate-binding protein
MYRRSLLQGSGAALAAATLSMPRLADAQASRPLRYIPFSDLAVLDPLGSLAIATRNHALMVWDTLFGLDRTFRPPAPDAGERGAGE